MMAFTAALTVLCCSCEKPVVDNGTEETGEQANLILSVKGFNVIPFDDTRSSAAVGDYCTRLNFVVYQDGKKLKAVNQEKGTSGFGQVAITLESGTYQVLVLAHSANGNPVLSDATKIQFSNDDGYTDTFYSYDDVTIETGVLTKEVVLERVTSMFRLITTDNVPDNVKRMRFYYLGGSGALDATTGYGCVNSKQVTFFDITDDMHGKPLRLEAYTIPKARTGTLKITVSAYNANTDVVYERELTDVPIEQNKITEYTGNMFVKDNKGDDPGDNPGQDSQSSFTVRLNTDWGGTLKGNF